METLAYVQAVLKLPELKVVKPSDTRWLSHERCINAICKELSALIITLQQLYESSGDAEAYGLVSILSSITGVACIYLLSEVLSLLARLNLFMQRKTSDFSKLPIVLSSIIQQLVSLKEPGTDWCNDADEAISNLEKEHGNTVKATIGITRNSFAADSVSDFQTKVAIPYVDALISNINHRFSDEVVQLVVSASIFNPSLLPEDENDLPKYGIDHLKALADFYGKQVEVEFEDKKYCSPPIIDRDGLTEEWRVFKRAFFQEKKVMVQNEKPLTMQAMKKEMESESSYSDIFPETFKLMNIILTIPIGTASVERSFSQMKMIKTRHYETGFQTAVLLS